MVLLSTAVMSTLEEQTERERERGNVYYLQLHVVQEKTVKARDLVFYCSLWFLNVVHPHLSAKHSLE